MATISDEEFLNKDQTEATEEVREKRGFSTFTPNDTILEALQADKDTCIINGMRKRIKDLQSISRKRKRLSSLSVRSNHAHKVSSITQETKATSRLDQLESDKEMDALPPPSLQAAHSAQETLLLLVAFPSTKRDMDVTSTDDEWQCQAL
ncbi:hypothetical protein ElyMa_001846700 [Elysia marginata]|uniref:Uncharacterized protein n=1 Tax=Elysia marginata TaxID=1093978 RepID=A0AAV4EKY0_9GAST|nr:hypothetical protein ElyMa_001846700 [Elysia marginata]